MSNPLKVVRQIQLQLVPLKQLKALAKRSNKLRSKPRRRITRRVLILTKVSETQKTEEELAADKAKAEKAEKDQKQEGAPEKYEFTAGEGVELDADALKDFEPVARDLNLTNEQAQKLVDAYPKILAGVQQRQAEAWQKQTEGWAETVKADKEIGGDKLTANLSAAQRALDQFGTPELKEYLNATGLGNHPDLVKTFVKIGKAMSEDGMVDGSNQGQRSAAEVLYG